jgi:hypothetical protein
LTSIGGIEKSPIDATQALEPRACLPVRDEALDWPLL